MHARLNATLHAIETESWLSATYEPNRQKGQERRTYLADQIRAKLRTMSKWSVDSALSLNISDDHVAHHQKLRRGVRAIMLAQFTLMGVPLSQAAVLKQRWIGATEDEIRRGFLACFPAVNDPNDPARVHWAPNNFTDPTTFHDWTHWNNNFPYRFILTCLPTDNRALPTLAAPTATISSWDAISTSVVDETNSVIYGYYGFVLSVPKENVVAANSEDQNLLNHLGTAMTRNAGAEANMSPMVKAGLLSQHLADLFAAQGRLKTPLECIRQNRNERWNEVIVLGRSPTTGRRTTVTALFYRVSSNHRYYVSMTGTKSPITDQIEGWVTAASQATGLPIIYIPDSTGNWG